MGKRYLKASVFGIIGACLFSLGLGCGTAAPEDGEIELMVGAKPFAEQRILSQILIAVLREAGIEATAGQESLTEIRELLTDGNIDAYWEYTGTGLLIHHGKGGEGDVGDGCKEARERLNALEEAKGSGVRWLYPASVDNTFVLVSGSNPEGGGETERLSDFIERKESEGQKLGLCIPPGFKERQGDGLEAFEDVYEEFWEHVKTKFGERAYRALGEEGECDVLVGYNTDSLISRYEFWILEDEKNFFPPYCPTPVFRQEVLERLERKGLRKGITQTLKCLGDLIDTEKMRKLNRKVEIEGFTPWDVARNFLKEEKAAACLREHVLGDASADS